MKICGINSAAAFDAAVEAGADWVGFVFFPPSPRALSPAQAAAISARIAGGPPRVGLFVEPSEAQIARVLDALPLDILQLYAAPDRAAALRVRFGQPVWRAVGVTELGDLPLTPEPVDGFLIEAKPPPDATRPGGNAIAIDWTLTQDWAPPLPWLLAGGLTPDNVADAIRLSGALAVDVSSGVEQAKGMKHPALIRRFIARAKAATAVTQAI